MADIRFYIPDDETIPTDLRLYVNNVYVKYKRIEGGLICFVLLAITVIPMTLWCVVTMSRDIDMVIKRCNSMKRWAKRNIDERKGDHHD